MTIDYECKNISIKYRIFNVQFSNYQKIILKHFQHGKATIESNFDRLLCPKSIKNGQIITDLAKTVHFGKCYFNKLQLNGKKYFFSKKTTSTHSIVVDSSAVYPKC
jgi:hypothetical protein